MSRRHALRLSVGATPAAKVVSATLAGVFALAAGGGAGLALRAGAPGLPGGPDPGSGAGGVHFAWRAVALVLAPVAVLLLYAMMRVVRHAAWLDGTVAIVRGAFRTRKVDLATAILGGGPSDRFHQRGHLFAGERLSILALDRDRGVKVHVPLRGHGLPRLPSAELEALANAIMAGRQPNDADYSVAIGVASHLRQLARSTAEDPGYPHPLAATDAG
jgi:hypothetical protein